MKNHAWHFLIVFVILQMLGCDGCDYRSTICDETPSTQYLVPVRSVNMNKISGQELFDPTAHRIRVCGSHFASGTRSGIEFDNAVEEWNRQQGHTVSFTTNRTTDHIEAFDLIQRQLNASSFDYLDVDAPMPSLCGLPRDLTFAIRTCGVDDRAGKTEWFTIFAKSRNYRHFSNPSSSDFPEDHGIQHELGHGLGMNHTNNWDAADKKYISTMQGNLKYLSALDVYWLRSKYPAVCPDHKNYVASSLTRFGGIKGVFDEQNPQAFYIDEDSLRDCATGRSPVFYVAWFNTGNLNGDSTKCVVNSIHLRQKNNPNEKIFIKTWRIATMPALSQDQWRGRVGIKLADPAAIDISVEWELVFITNYWNSDTESTDIDNTITMDVSIHRSRSCSGRSLQVSPTGEPSDTGLVFME